MASSVAEYLVLPLVAELNQGVLYLHFHPIPQVQLLQLSDEIDQYFKIENMNVQDLLVPVSADTFYSTTLIRP